MYNKLVGTKTLEKRIVDLCLDFLKENKALPLYVVLGNVLYKLSNLVVVKNKGNISKGAADICENRSTISERLRTKCNLSEEELQELCKLHGIEYHPRKRNQKFKKFLTK